MNQKRTSYIIFVRPPGSQMWTQHMKKGNGIPYTSYRRCDAEREAVGVTVGHHYCTRVVAIEHPKEIDNTLYAQMADGDVRFYPQGI